MAKIKRMCKSAKDGLKANEEDLMVEIQNAKYVCKKCLRVARDKKLLCDPKKLKE